MSDLGAIVTVLDDIFRYVTDPHAYPQWSLEEQLNALHASSKAALDARDFAAFDRLTAELKRLRLETV